jgi:hypothetical protein
MIWTKRLFAAIAGAILLVSTVPARALTLQAGNTATYNIDFTGQSPPPPYADDVDVLFTVSGVDAGDFATFQWFDGLNAAGGLVRDLTNISVDQWAVPVNGELWIYLIGFGYPQLIDGVFSIAITVDQGAFTIESATAYAYEDPVDPEATIAAQLAAITGIPEPGSLALLGSGLAALSRLRRRLR